MKYRETPWEKRNLGVEGCEFCIDLEDRAADVFEKVKECTKEYQLLRIASGNTEVLLAAQEYGFQCMEMDIEIQCLLKQCQYPSIYEKFVPYLTYGFADETEKNIVLDTIRQGEIFSTDKISRDTYFGKKQAGIRYAYWAEDILDAGGKLILTKYKNDNIGFLFYREKEDVVVDACLGGIFPKYFHTGMGFSYIYSMVKSFQQAGYDKVISHVSSNNLPVLKIHERFGFSVSSMSYILIKHLAKEDE